jgi:hypothetical protein
MSNFSGSGPISVVRYKEGKTTQLGELERANLDHGFEIK